LSGFWRFKLDPRGEGEREGWHRGFESSDVVYVPSSWNEQNPLWDGFDGVAWHSTSFYVRKELEGKLAWLVFKGAGYARDHELISLGKKKFKRRFYYVKNLLRLTPSPVFSRSLSPLRYLFFNILPQFSNFFDHLISDLRNLLLIP
jgi:hypothetical protein